MLATGRAKIKDGTLIITAVDKSDNGAFYCTATNSEGSETLEVQMSVTSPLTAAIQPTVQTVNLGKTADLVRIHFYANPLWFLFQKEMKIKLETLYACTHTYKHTYIDGFTYSKYVKRVVLRHIQKWQ